MPISRAPATPLPSKRIAEGSGHDFNALMFGLIFVSTVIIIHCNIKHYAENTFTFFGTICMLILIKLLFDMFVYLRFSVITKMRGNLFSKYNNNIINPSNTIIYQNKLINEPRAYQYYYKYDNITQCAICQEEFTEFQYINKQSPLQLLRCGHLYHRDCILQNEQHRNQYISDCPMCRNPYHILSGKYDFNNNFNKGLFTSYYAGDIGLKSNFLKKSIWKPLLKLWFMVFPNETPTLQSLNSYSISLNIQYIESIY